MTVANLSQKPSYRARIRTLNEGAKIPLPQNEQRPKELPKPGGVSGGGLWHSFAPDASVWSADDVKLFGIQSSWSERMNYLRGSQIQHWLGLLHKYEPALRETIQSSFADVEWQTLHPHN